MKSAYGVLVLILMLSIIFLSCSNETNRSFINERYTHQLPNCDNSGNPEINCTEFIEFSNRSQVDVLVGGGDIIIRTSYNLDSDLIAIEKAAGLNIDLSFRVQDENSLIRIEDDEVWVRDQ